MTEMTHQHGMIYCIVCDSHARIVFPYSDTDGKLVLDTTAKATCLGCNREKTIGGWIYSQRDPNAPEEANEDDNDDEKDPVREPDGSLKRGNYVSIGALLRTQKEFKKHGLDFMYIGVDDTEEMEALTRRNAEFFASVRSGSGPAGQSAAPSENASEGQERRVVINLRDLVCPKGE